MFLLLGSRGDLDGETVDAARRMDGQRHALKPGLRMALLGWRILCGSLGAARRECNEGEG